MEEGRQTNLAEEQEMEVEESEPKERMLLPLRNVDIKS